MRVLTEQQLKEISEIIEKHVGVLLHVFTKDGKPVDKKTLKKLGLPENSASLIENAFILGKLIQALGSEAVEALTYDELKGKIRKYTLSKVEQNSVRFAEEQAARYVTALGSNISQKVQTTIHHTNQTEHLKAIQREAIKDKIVEGIEEGMTRRQLASELYHALDDTTRDWRRVAHTELWNAKLQGEVVSILQGDTIHKDTDKGDTTVFRKPAPDACNNCKRLYLEKDGITPKTFTLNELINNGTNVGLKVADWKPTTGTTHPNCFVSGDVSVFTAKGYKKIKDIKVGDFVLTHKGRFKPVIATLEDYKEPYAGDVIEISVARDSGRPKKLLVTPEHKFLTEKGWLRADQITTENELFELQDVCDRCGDYFPKVTKATTCKSCRVFKQWERRYADKDEFKRFRDKISKSVKKHQEDPNNRVKHTESHKKRMSEMLKRRNPMSDPDVIARKVATDERLGHTERARQRMLKGGAVKAMLSAAVPSKPQLALYENVLKIFPDAKLETVVTVSPTTTFALDITVASEMLNIEYDGSYWHRNSKEKDARRDAILGTQGWTVLRYCDYVPDVETLCEDIHRVLKNHDGVYDFESRKVVSVEHKQVKKRKLYDITVDEDHSFIANGVVSHNCTCPLAVLPRGFGFDEYGEIEFKG